MPPIPVKVSRRIIALYDRGKTTAAIANALEYYVVAIRRFRQLSGERGTLAPATTGTAAAGGSRPQSGPRCGRTTLRPTPRWTGGSWCRRLVRWPRPRSGCRCGVRRYLNTGVGRGVTANSCSARSGSCWNAWPARREGPQSG